ncbi:zinc finger, CCHC-type, retrotransposon gag domain protein [Tanacetum coccineum]|uniref:Zinc finger, CCHC-type, retrotransposon gag domain protein n=1 Tax=Tanacetum coccineum TaxID=301880 RepID=A0ABQ4Z0P1_9ASTR
MVTTRRNSDDDVPNFEAMITAAVANALPNLTAALRTQITNDIRNGVGSSGGGGGGDAIPQGIHVWIERFTKLKPLAFRSAATPAEAEDWITHMEKLFQVLGCPDNFKTRLAAFKLEGDALSWWKAHLRTQVGGDAFADTCTWVAFREIFYNRYFPASEQQRYEREYGSICQLDRENSGEYMERFTRLASFVGATAGDAQRQARHFKWGLKKWVLDRIVNTDYTNVAQVAAARNIELLHESGNSNKQDRDGNQIQNRGQGQQENKGRYDQGYHEYRGRQDQSVEHRGRQDRGSAGQRRSTETLPPPPLCTTCWKAPLPGLWHHYGIHQRLRLSPNAETYYVTEVRSVLGPCWLFTRRLLRVSPDLALPLTSDRKGFGGFQIYSDASKKGLCVPNDHGTFDEKVMTELIVLHLDIHPVLHFILNVVYGQQERTIQTLEDMLRACALEWTEVVMLLKHRRELEFQVGDRVFLKVSPFKELKSFWDQGQAQSSCSIGTGGLGLVVGGDGEGGGVFLYFGGRGLWGCGVGVCGGVGVVKYGGCVEGLCGCGVGVGLGSCMLGCGGGMIVAVDEWESAGGRGSGCGFGGHVVGWECDVVWGGGMGLDVGGVVIGRLRWAVLAWVVGNFSGVLKGE